MFAALRDDRALHDQIHQIAMAGVAALKKGNKLLFAGNGGSAADAQHLAGELVSRFAFDRPGLAAFSLSTDTSVITAIGNDYGYDKLFARQVESVGVPGDLFIGLTTSGRSPNILNAFAVARKRELITVAITGTGNEQISQCCDYCLRIPSVETPRIQEGTILVGHILCGIIESAMFPKAP